MMHGYRRGLSRGREKRIRPAPKNTQSDSFAGPSPALESRYIARHKPRTSYPPPKSLLSGTRRKVIRGSNFKEEKSAIHLSNLGNFAILDPRLFIDVRPVGSLQSIYVRAVGSPENTSDIRENPNINDWCDALALQPPWIFPRIMYGTFLALKLGVRLHFPIEFPRSQEAHFFPIGRLSGSLTSGSHVALRADKLTF